MPGREIMSMKFIAKITLPNEAILVCPAAQSLTIVTATIQDSAASAAGKFVDVGLGDIVE